MVCYNGQKTCGVYVNIANYFIACILLELLILQIATKTPNRSIEIEVGNELTLDLVGDLI